MFFLQSRVPKYLLSNVNEYDDLLHFILLTHKSVAPDSNDESQVSDLLRDYLMPFRHTERANLTQRVRSTLIIKCRSSHRM